LNPHSTIVAISTASGRGGIGVVRLSGDQALPIARTLPHGDVALPSWTPVLAHLTDAQGAVIDQAVVTYFARPKSYTAEDVVEIACHGSPVVLRTTWPSHTFSARVRLIEASVLRFGMIVSPHGTA